MADLVLGPMLRYADSSCATVWVETDGPCEVEVCGASARTFRVGAHHYALVVVRSSGSADREYDVRLDGRVVWPRADTAFPPSVLRSPPARGPLRVVVGSCRAVSGGPETGPDALAALALRMVRGEVAEWPHLLLFVGDQVYADEVPPGTRRFLRRARDTSKPPYEQVANFEEYTRLYREAWSQPVVRWLLSTVPTAMIFDDHDVADDWNTSEVWRREHQATGWWQPRIVGALASYWLYQHLGNLSPAAIEEEGVLARLQGADDGWPLLRELAITADAEADGGPGHRWSYRRDLDGVRLLVVDSRCGRVLAGDRREMLDPEEWDWLAAQTAGDVDHLLVASSLPVLLPAAISSLESWDEAVCGGAWGRRLSRVGERLRQGLDLEHWAAFRDSFARLLDLVAAVGSGAHGRPPASVVFLSGDVHYAYLAETEFPPAAGVRTPVYQLVSSPMRNPIPRFVQVGDRAARTRVGRAVGEALGRSAGVPPPAVRWEVTRGPWFDNNLATLELDGRELAVTFECAYGDPADPRLETVWAGELVRRPLPEGVTQLRRAPERSPQ